MIIVQSVADLQAVDTTNLESGVPAYIADVPGLYYVFDSASAVAASGSAVIQPTVGPGQWFISYLAPNAAFFTPLTKNVAAGGTFTLTPTEYAPRHIILTGTLLGNATVEFPALAGREWVVKNSTVLGIFSVKIQVVGSLSPITLLVGTLQVWTDGTDLLQVSPLV